MTTDDPLPTVQRMFEAFVHHDLDALVETVHPDSRWTYIGANPRPAKGTFVGKDGVRKFFENIFQRLDIATFHASQFVTQNDTVVIFGYESGTIKKTGDPFRNEWTQKYVVRNNLIIEMAEYNIQVSTTS